MRRIISNMEWKFIVAYIGVYLIGQGSGIEVQICEKGWLRRFDDCYTLLKQQDIPIEQARAQCKSLGGHLAPVPSAEKSLVLQHLIRLQGIPETEVVLLPLRFNYTVKNFQWDDGSDMIYDNWDKDEPTPRDQASDANWPRKSSNGEEPEDCVLMNGSGHWEDTICSSMVEVTGIICEKKTIYGKICPF